MPAGNLTRLFSPGRIGGLRLKNRLVMAPMATDYAGEEGRVSQKLIDYHAARARGGVGLIIAEVTGIDARYPYIPRTVGLWSDELIEGYRRLSEAVHEEGARLMPQLAHPGPESLSPLLTGLEAVGPSAGTINSLTRTACRELARDELEQIKRQFAETAERALQAGCDGIELHAAHGYMLLGSFLSALRNRRTDDYGGSLDNRLRFPLEVLAAIRSKVGRDFPIILRISAEEPVPGGRSLRETQYILPRFVEAGIDAVHVSSGLYPDLSWRVIPPYGTPLAPNAALAAAIKQAVEVPVLVVGRINDPRLAEDILRRGEADFTVMGRALLADPELPAKAAEGRFDDVAPCIACGLGCVVARERGGEMTCLINPRLGREGEPQPGKAAVSRRVLVAGGGPAGLEAASTAAQRGHRVTLYERTGRLGGQYNLAAVAEGKQELTRVIQYLDREARRTGVDMRLDTELTPELLAELRPEALVVATGSEPCLPEWPGGGPATVCAADVLAGSAPRPSGRVLVAGGGTVGCEVAELLAGRGDNPEMAQSAVTLVEAREGVGLEMFSEARVLLLERLRSRGVTILTSTTIEGLSSEGVVVRDAGGRRTLTGFDAVILALGARPVDHLSGAARDLGIPAYVIGDARAPRQALEAIAEGYEAALAIE
jgi:2,4-dienoyl-CoA reductase-like NADH-dependent reductase (Old Yellow Enzyme family)/thioredoxin reductase